MERKDSDSNDDNDDKLTMTETTTTTAPIATILMIQNNCEQTCTWVECE